MTAYVNDGGDVARALEAILRERPGLVGLSLADGGSAFLPLALGEALARAGYGGHVTSGGQFATLAREWLLARHPWLDSVVRFAGEEPIVEIAERVARGARVHGIPGVTTRQGDGPPADVTNRTPMTLRPARDELPEVLGMADRIVVLFEGSVAREFSRADADEHAIMSAATGMVEEVA